MAGQGGQKDPAKGNLYPNDGYDPMDSPGFDGDRGKRDTLKDSGTVADIDMADAGSDNNRRNARDNNATGAPTNTRRGI